VQNLSEMLETTDTNVVTSRMPMPESCAMAWVFSSKPAKYTPVNTDRQRNCKKSSI
jgi:hypothetical protein